MAIRTVCLHDEVAKQLADFGRQSSQRIVIDHRGCERRHCPVDQNSRRDRQLMSQCNDLGLQCQANYAWRVAVAPTALSAHRVARFTQATPSD